MRINTNINAMTALNQSSKNTALAGNSMAKLSSGLRINKAGDDAAGLAISEKMRAQIKGLDQAAKNTQDGVSLVQTAEGAMEEVGNIAQRMRELSVQSSNETNTLEDRQKIATELKELNGEIDRIAKSTTFNNEKILMGGSAGLKTPTSGIGSKAEITNVKINSNLDGAVGMKLTDDGKGKITLTLYSDAAATAGKEISSQAVDLGSNIAKGTVNFDKLGVSFEIDGSKTNNITTVIGGGTGLINEINQSGTAQKNVAIQAGANNELNNTLTINIGSMTSDTLGIKNIDIDKMAEVGDGGTAAAKDFITTLDTALGKISTARSTLGSQQNRLEYAQNNLTTSSENLTAAESRIRDVDVAKEMMNLSKLNLLNQASQAMMSQAKSQPEGVMQLLR